MNSYSLALFVHIVGALGFFMALGLEWASLYQAQRAISTEQLRAWMRVVSGSYRVGMPSMITLLISGIYMMATVWGYVAWIAVSLGALVLLILLVMTLIRPRLATIERAVAAEQGPIPPPLYLLLQHPQLWIATQIRFAIALGIVFLMTVKPDLSGALLTLGVAIGLGLVAALPMVGRARKQQTAVA